MNSLKVNDNEIVLKFSISDITWHGIQQLSINLPEFTHFGQLMNWQNNFANLCKKLRNRSKKNNLYFKQIEIQSMEKLKNPLEIVYFSKNLKKNYTFAKFLLIFRRMIRAKSVDLESEQQSGIAVTIDFSLHNENDQKKQLQRTDSTNQGI